MLTTGMNRGPSHHVGTLDLTSTPYPLSEFCLILSLVGIFSPEYKLLGEQCYWYADVVYKAIQMRTGAGILPGPAYNLAGRYGPLKIWQSEDVRTRLLGTFEVLAEYQGIEKGKESSDWWSERGPLISDISFLLRPGAGPDGHLVERIYANTAELHRRSVGALALITMRPHNQAAIHDAPDIFSNLLRLAHQHDAAEICECSMIAATNICLLPSPPTLLEPDHLPYVHHLLYTGLRSHSLQKQLVAIKLFATVVWKIPQVKAELALVSVISFLSEHLCSPSTSMCLRFHIVQAMYYTLTASASPTISNIYANAICNLVDLLASRSEVQTELGKALDKLPMTSSLRFDTTLTVDLSRIISLVTASEPTIQDRIDYVIGRVFPHVKLSVTERRSFQLHRLTPTLPQPPPASKYVDDVTPLLQQLFQTLFPSSLPESNALRLHYLGLSFQQRLEKTGDIQDMEEATSTLRQAVELTLYNHADLSRRLSDLANSLVSRFNQFEEIPDLEEAVELRRQATRITSPHDIDYSSRQSDLGKSLHLQYRFCGGIRILYEAMTSLDRSVHWTPAGHPCLPSRRDLLFQLCRVAGSLSL
jgi:hypothetical protein